MNEKEWYDNIYIEELKRQISRIEDLGFTASFTFEEEEDFVNVSICGECVVGDNIESAVAYLGDMIDGMEWYAALDKLRPGK